MKKILLLAFICIAIALDVDETKDLKGPAANLKHPNSQYSCHNDSWHDTVNGVSDCVDHLLYDTDPERRIYYDHCCYIRYQKDGDMHSDCIGLTEENFLDITITMKRLEKGDRSLLGDFALKTAGSKIYQIDCFSSYLKSLSFASILLLALFF